MTFTYAPSIPMTDRDRVRFHVQDTDPTAPIFTDEEIAAFIAELGSWQQTVILCIQSLIAKLANTPNFTADWLTVSTQSQLEQLKVLLAEKRRMLGVTSITGKVITTYRPDSRATGPGDDSKVQSDQNDYDYLGKIW